MEVTAGLHEPLQPIIVVGRATQLELADYVQTVELLVVGPVEDVSPRFFH